MSDAFGLISALLVAAAAPQTAAAGPPADSVAVAQAGVNLEWPEPPSSARYRVGELLLVMSNDVDRNDPSILRRSLRIELPGFSAFTIDPGEDDAHEPAVMVVATPSGAPTILFQTYSGGAHCCTSTTAIAPRDGRLEGVLVYRGDGGPIEEAPSDLDGDGRIDFVRPDNAFLYRFASYADSYAPPRIVNVVGGEAVDVSGRPGFRPLFEEAMREAGAVCTEAGNSAPNGACAGYVAAAARLGRFDEAWARMLSAYDRTSDWGLEGGCRVQVTDGSCPPGQEQSFASYPEALRHFLIETGYIER